MLRDGPTMEERTEMVSCDLLKKKKQVVAVAVGSMRNAGIFLHHLPQLRTFSQKRAKTNTHHLLVCIYLSVCVCWCLLPKLVPLYRR